MIEGEVPVFNVKDKEPLISVVLPVYNGEKYLVEAIDSILAQTFVDFELIMIDDGSTDGSFGILQKYENQDARVRVFTRENRGLVATLNEGIDLARGSWIARMDQDDIALPQRFERQLKWLEQTGADICGSWVQRFGTSDKRVVRLHKTDEAIKTEIMFSSPFVHPSVMMRTAMVRQLHYDVTCEKAEDYDFWVRAAVAGWKMTNVPEVLLRYRVHSEQISTKTMILQHQVGQKIRRRYWVFMFSSMKLNINRIDEALKVFEPSLIEIDMDAVDLLFAELLQHSSGQSSDIIFGHVTRLYCRVAASCPDIVSRWSNLNRVFGNERGLGIKFRLWLFRRLRIRLNGDIFKNLKKLYVWSMWW